MTPAAGLDPYLDPVSGVLRNRLGISEARALSVAETTISTAAMARLLTDPPAGRFDLEHLAAVHRRLFGPVYPWAGELRTVEITKGTTRFAAARFVAAAAADLFGQLHGERLLRGLDDRTFVERLAHYYSEINVLHPFREGNGRTQRGFFTLLAAECGRHIAWERLDRERNVEASAAAYLGREEALVELLAPLLERAGPANSAARRPRSR